MSGLVRRPLIWSSEVPRRTVCRTNCPDVISNITVLAVVKSDGFCTPGIWFTAPQIMCRIGLFQAVSIFGKNVNMK
jgi:hypothetical protein